MNLNKEKPQNKERILLLMLPFLTPLIPPMGISCLKGYLEQKGFKTKVVDVLSDLEIKEIVYQYFYILKDFIPKNKRGHFFNIALDVLYNHFIAHINYTDEGKYNDLVRQLVFKNFYVKIDHQQISEINEIVEDFYLILRKYLEELFQREKPTIVGLSVYRGTLGPSIFASKIIKEIDARIRVVMGGPIFSQELYPGTPNFERFLQRVPYIDKIFIGEGEQLFYQYLKGKLPENQKYYTLKDINDEILDLEKIGIPDLRDYDLSGYLALPFFTSRGCIHQCSFCAETLYWKKYHCKTPQTLVKDFEELSQKYKKNFFVLTDCLINPLVTPLSKEIIARDLEVYWDVCIKVDRQLQKSENCQLWRKAGFYRARLGIESGSMNVLSMINKGTSIEEIKAAVSNLASAGIKTTTYWIAGHPGETEEDFKKTLELLTQLRENIYDAECNPFRYFYRGQVNEAQWAENEARDLLYPADTSDMMITQTWELKTEPSREIIYERCCRFKEHCDEIEIPNPYSVKEINEADDRWNTLHKNAVPPVISFL